LHDVVSFVKPEHLDDGFRFVRQLLARGAA
jgi:hypothetical protein